jgi:hypothetical protein
MLNLMWNKPNYIHFIIHPDVAMTDGHSIPKYTHASKCRFCPRSYFCGCSILLPSIYAYNKEWDNLKDLGMNGMVAILYAAAKRNSEVWKEHVGLDSAGSELAIVDTAINLRVPKYWRISVVVSTTISFLRKTLLHRIMCLVHTLVFCCVNRRPGHSALWVW